MNHYQFKNVLSMNKHKMIPVEDENNQQVGHIQKAILPGCEKETTFSFVSNDGQEVVIGIKNRGLKNLLVPTYVIKAPDQTYTLKDKIGNNLLYFCLIGEMDGQSIRIEENWDQHIEVKKNKTVIATIQNKAGTMQQNISITEDVLPSMPLFAVTVLMYFMYKVYNDEADLIGHLFFN